MSVLLPWQRHPKLVGPIQSYRQKNRPRHRRRSTAAFLSRILTYLGLALAVYTLVHAVSDYRVRFISAEFPTLWQAESILAYSGPYAVVETSDRTVLMGPSGVICELPREVRQAVFSRDRVYAVDESRLLTCDARARVYHICDIHKDEKLVACSGYENALLVRPEKSGQFGEPWVLRAVTAGGATLWAVNLPGIPAVEATTSNAITLGLRDISAGGQLYLANLDALAGTVLWVRRAGTGAWRGLAVDADGSVVYATSTEVALVDSYGNENWSYTPGGEVTAVSVAEDSVIVAHNSPGYPLVEALSSAGEPIWKARVPTAPHSIHIDGMRAVALCQSHVIGFSLEDGTRERYLATRDLPLSLADGALLMCGESGAYLLKTEENEGN